jgi:hypothetical protein
MPLQQIDLTQIQQLFKPENVARVIRDTETHGTQTLDRYYPPSTRETWDQILVPVEEITDITRAAGLSIRGGSSHGIGGESQNYDYIEPQPVKLTDGLNATEFENARQVSMQSVQDLADRKVARLLETHRKTAEGMAATTIQDGTLTWPIFDDQGNVIDTFDVNFGSLQSYTVTADWTASSTTLSTIYQDLKEMKRVLERAGYGGNRVSVGTNAFASILEKVEGQSNESRLPARVDDEGRILLAEFTIMEMSGEYYDPQAGAYQSVLGTNQLLMDDESAPWTHLWVRLDNFKMNRQFGADAMRGMPLGVVAELSGDGDQIQLYSQSKPLPIPPVNAMLKTDVSTP